MDAREHLCHLPQPPFSIARRQVHFAGETRHEDGGTAERSVAGSADHTRGRDVTAFELGEDRCLPQYCASHPLLPLVVGHPPAQDVVLAAAVFIDGQPVDDRRETAREWPTSQDSDSAPKRVFDPRE